jgi:hypothetical protein
MSCEDKKPYIHEEDEYEEKVRGEDCTLEGHKEMGDKVGGIEVETYHRFLNDVIEEEIKGFEEENGIDGILVTKNKKEETL